MEDGYTKKNFTEEYHLGQGTIAYWFQKRRKECQINLILKEDTNSYEEIKRLRKELAETKKENDFLK